MNNQTPKHFVVQLGSLAALYVSITSLLVLLFGVINVQFPDAAAYYAETENAQAAIRVSIATLSVFFPAYLVLTRISSQHRRKETDGAYMPVTQWLVYLSLLVAGVVMLADLVVLINYFLEGEITQRFLLKILTLMTVVGLAFYYYLLDIRGYFIKKQAVALYFGLAALMMVLVSLLYGFSSIETPSVVREMRIDENQIMDLQSMQRTIEIYYQTNQTLPTSLDVAYTQLQQPVAPDGLPTYTYTVLDEQSYELCANFFHESSTAWEKYQASEFDPNYSWQHGAGQWCFARTVQTLDKAPLIR